ncbi:MAG: acyl-ACP--UDP-N-acetylglucosamine O-acyltransferase [Silicimonas sp.]|nr:acyl-ACP--UDP-N-acetylglucosamine O-acyltransferase [Silicimonas sp.]
MSDIHPSAIIEEGAQLGEGVRIGPFCTVGANVVLGDRVHLKSHVVVTGQTQVGADTVIFPFAVIGEIPQDLKYDGEPTQLIIGERNTIREAVTMNTGTTGGGGVTRIGDDCLIMGAVHVAHDAQVGNRVIVGNYAALTGHVIIEDDVIVGGLSGIHQFTRIGQGAIIGGASRVTRDVIPFGLVQNENAELEGLNLIGLKRRGVDRADITEIRAAYQALGQGEGTFLERTQALDAATQNAHVKTITQFILSSSDRSYLQPKV